MQQHHPEHPGCWGLLLRKRKVGTAAREDLGVIAGRYLSSIKHGVSCLGSSGVLTPD